MAHQTELRIRFNECDPQGHVFNGNYFIYADAADVEFWRSELGGYTTFTANGLDVLVAEVNVRFHAAAYFDEVLTVTTSVDRIGTTSLMLRHEMAVDDRITAVVIKRLVCVGTADRRKTAIPDSLRSALAAHVAEPAAA